MVRGLAQARDGQGAGAAPADPRGRQARDDRGARRRFPDPAGIHRGVSRQGNSGAALARARAARARACDRVWPKAGDARDRRAADVDHRTCRAAGRCPSTRARSVSAGSASGTPKGALARDVAEAKDIAARIGYPVVLKAQAAALAHKSDAGGVALDIADADCARRSVATRDRERRRQTAGPRARRHAGRGDGAARRRADRRGAARSAMGDRPAWSGSAASGPRRSTTCG